MFNHSKDNYGRNTLYSVFGFGILTLGNFLFNSIAGRKLGPEAFGVFNSFFYFLLSFTYPNTSLQLSVAKWTVENPSQSYKDVLTRLSKTLYLIGFILAFAIMLASPFLKRIFTLDSLVEVFIGAMIVFFWLVLAGYRGIYQGRLDFYNYGINTGAEGLARALAGILLILAGLKVRGALFASVLGSIAGILLIFGQGFKGLRSIFREKLDIPIIKYFFKTCVTLIPFGFISSLDLTIVKYAGNKTDSGFLSACALFGKNLIILSLVFANVVFSYVLKKRENRLLPGIIFTIFSFIGSTVFTLFFGEWIIMILFGREFLVAAKLLPVYILSSLPLGIMQNLVNYSVAKDIKSTPVFLWIMLLVSIVIYYLSIKAFCVNTFLIIVMCLLFVWDMVLYAGIWIMRRETK